MHWCGPKRVTDTLHREFILRIKAQRRSELRQRLDWPVLHQIAVSAFQMHTGEMLPCNLARRHILYIFRNQASCILELVQRFIQIFRLFEFETA